MKVNALKLRQNLGRYLDQVSRGQEPLIVEKDQVPVVAMVSMGDYQRYFVDVRERAKARELSRKFRASSKAESLSPEVDSLAILREIRGYDPDR